MYELLCQKVNIENMFTQLNLSASWVPRKAFYLERVELNNNEKQAFSLSEMAVSAVYKTVQGASVFGSVKPPVASHFFFFYILNSCLTE